MNNLSLAALADSPGANQAIPAIGGELAALTATHSIFAAGLSRPAVATVVVTDESFPLVDPGALRRAVPAAALSDAGPAFAVVRETFEQRRATPVWRHFHPRAK
jgi:hypothetical protein